MSDGRKRVVRALWQVQARLAMVELVSQRMAAVKPANEFLGERFSAPSPLTPAGLEGRRP